MNTNKTFEWKEYADKNYYFETNTGKIHGMVTKYALQDVWIALVYPNEYGNAIADEKHLGQFISGDKAKKAIERFWEIENRTMLMGPAPSEM